MLSTLISGYFVSYYKNTNFFKSLFDLSYLLPYDSQLVLAMNQ